MIFHLYKVPKVDEYLTKLKSASIKHIVELLRKEHSQRKDILLYDCYRVDSFIEEINKTCLKYFETDFDKIEIEGYLIDGKIQSKYHNGFCDGFAYWDNGYVIVVSSKTDIFSVICHEICHIILHTIFEDLSKIPIYKIEEYVELIEFLISQNKDWAYNCMKKHFSEEVMNNAIDYESQLTYGNLDIFIKELEAKR